MAWGTPAAKRIDEVVRPGSPHYLLKSVHPSPLSAARGFFEARHFRLANEWLAKKGKTEIDWNCL